MKSRISLQAIHHLWKYLLTFRNGSLYFVVRCGRKHLITFHFLPAIWLLKALSLQSLTLFFVGKAVISVAFPRHYFNRTLFFCQTLYWNIWKTSNVNDAWWGRSWPNGINLDCVLGRTVGRADRFFHLFLCIYWCLGWRWGQTGDLESTIMYTIHPEEKTTTEKTIGF